MAGRPEHHDFWRLVAVVNEGDDQADAGMPIEQIMERVIDPPSLLYMADQRLLRAQQHSRALRNLTAEARTSILSLYFDAFRAGVRFEQEGGHSDG